MATATEATVSSILKEVYPGMVEDELNNECALWAIVDKTKVSVGGQGKRIVRPMRAQRNSGVGSRPDNGTLPQAGAQSYINSNINIATTYLRGQISNRVMRTSATDTAAFADVLEEEIKFGLSDYVTDLSRQLYYGTGKITVTNGTVTSSTSVVVTDVTNLAVGMIIEFWNGGTNQTTVDAGLTAGSAIAAINATTLTLTMTTAQTSITSGATVARQGNNTSATATYEMNGLDFTVDDGTDFAGASYFGNAKASFPILFGNRVDISAASGTGSVPGDSTVHLSENKMQYGVDQARKIGGGYIDVFITGYDTRRTYSNILLGNKRYPVEGITAPQFSGGFQRSQDLRTNLAEGLSFDGAPVVASRQAPLAKMWGLDTSSWKIFQQSDIEWVLNGDSVLHPLMAASNQDAYQYAMLYDAQFYSEAPNRNIKYVNCLN